MRPWPGGAAEWCLARCTGPTHYGAMKRLPALPSNRRHMRSLALAMIAIITLPMAVMLGAATNPVIAASCDAPVPVCAWQDRIVGIKTPNMIASGTVLPGGYIVTNHHVA